MRSWKNRSEEVKNLLNPAFCGRILYASVSEYLKKTNCDFPLPLLYLILPLVLPSKIRTEINSRAQFANWIQGHQELLFDFSKRTKDLIEITNESVEFMMQTGYLRLTDNGNITKVLMAGNLSKNKYIDSEVKECLSKAEHVGRWFAGAGKVETIYICLGVRP